MVALKSRFRVMRRGFVLPMSLVATFITLMIVGASATYCTTHLRTSQEYLNRTRCRLAAQSAIELAKNELSKATVDSTDKVTDPVTGASAIDLSSKVDEISERMRQKEILRRIPGYGPDMKVYVDIQSEEGVNRIYATAEQTAAGQQTSVTLQENVKIPLTGSDIFSYAYFANGDGHLVSKYLTVNGDVRCNQNFYLSGANVNGYIYAPRTVHLADSTSDLKTWWDGRYVTVRTAKSYNQAFRQGSYAKARPTNPLAGGKVWAGGFEGARAPLEGSLLNRLVTALMDLIRSLDVRYDDGELPLTSEGVNKTKDRIVSEHTNRPIVNEGNDIRTVTMPRIVGDWESETDKDKHLQYYKTVAASAPTPKLNTGGSLSCSNSWVTADGTNVQLSALVKLMTKKTIHHPGGTMTVHHDKEPTIIHHGEQTITVHHDTRIVKHDAWDETKTAASQIPSDGIPVYDPMRRREVLALSLSLRQSDREKAARYTEKLADGYVNEKLTPKQLFTKADYDRVAPSYLGDLGFDPLAEFARNGWEHSQEGLLSDLVEQFWYDPKSPIGYVRLDVKWEDEARTKWTVTYEYVSFGREQTADYDLTKEKLIVARSIPLYECQAKWSLLKYNRSVGSGENHNSSGWLFLHSDLDAFSDTLLHPFPYDIDEEEVRNVIKTHFDSSGWGTGAMYYDLKQFPASPEKYVIIEVWRVSKGGQVKMEIRHHIVTKNESDKNNGDTDYGDKKPNDAKDDYYIPVYRWKAKRDWYDKKEDWPTVWSSGAYRNTKPDSEMYNYVFESDALEAAAKSAQRMHTGNGGLDAATVKSLFEGDAKDGWAGKNTSSSDFRSKQPVGYLKIHVGTAQYTAQKLVASYELKSVRDITLHHDAYEEVLNEPWDEEVVQPAYDEEGETEPWDEVIPIEPYDEETNMVDVVRRELRGVFVKGGYYVDSDASLVPPEDLKVVTAGDLIGKKTEDLRPFREDAAESNKKTQAAQPDKGAVILIGTWDHPIVIDGPVVFESDVIIRGFVSGRGTIYSGRNIHVIGDINYKNPPYWPDNGGTVPLNKGCDMLTLVSRGCIVIGNYVSDKMWTDTSNGLLWSNYINAEVNNHPSAVYKRQYVKTNYTALDSHYRKVKYDKLANGFTDDSLKLYESVVGDYVFLSELSTTDSTKVDENWSLERNGSSCLFSQHWDTNPGNYDTDFHTNTTYQSGIIDAYVESRKWSANDRTDNVEKSFNKAIWDGTAQRYQTDFRTFCRNNYAITDLALRKSVNYIQTINAVLYASMGLFGVVGGRNTPCVINGALIANDEALLPFARNRRSYLIGTEASDDLTLTLNWDIRLNPNSGDAVENDETDDAYHQLTFGDISLSGGNDPGLPQPISWQEVPDKFNRAWKTAHPTEGD